MEINDFKNMVSKEDENYSKMNKFLEDLYKESIVYVN